MGFIKYKQKNSNLLKLEKYLKKYVDRKQYLERSNKIDNRCGDQYI